MKEAVCVTDSPSPDAGLAVLDLPKSPVENSVACSNMAIGHARITAFA